MKFCLLLFTLLISIAIPSEGQDLNVFADSIRKAHQIPELAFAVVSKDSILLNVQLGSHRHDQQGSRYFAAYKQHESTERFFTSDYDLSTFRNLSAGGSILYRPSENLSRKLWIQSLKLRYQYNHRSNNLVGHIISLVIGLHKEDR